MSPIIDGKNVIEADGFFRNERGLLAMAHLVAVVGVATGVWLIALASWGFIMTHDGWMVLLNVGGGIIAAAIGLEGYEAKVEGMNLRGGGQ